MGCLGGALFRILTVFLVAVKCNLINSASDLHKRRDPYSWIKIHVVLGKTESKRRRGKRGAKVPHCRPFPPGQMVGGQVDHQEPEQRLKATENQLQPRRGPCPHRHCPYHKYEHSEEMVR